MTAHLGDDGLPCRCDDPVTNHGPQLVVRSARLVAVSVDRDGLGWVELADLELASEADR